MAYKSDNKNAAMRHLEAAEFLYTKSKRRDVAGYLFGIAAECAIKEAFLGSAIVVKALAKKEDPVYAHFPDLQRLLRNHVSRRRGASFLPFLNKDFMKNWDIKMRYSSSKDIDLKLVDLWREQAKQAISSLSIFFRS